MIGIQPFRGQVVSQKAAHDVVSPAYDALSADQRRTFRAEHPNSYLHVTRSAADEHDAATVDNATLVRRGRAALEALVARDLFTSHGEPAFFVYQLSIGGHSQSGLVCEVPSDYYRLVAKPHEATSDDRAALLAEHFSTVKAASSPVACAVRDDGRLASDLAIAEQQEKPVLDITGDDGLRQTIWRVNDAALEARLIAQLENADLFIIDGHHRSAANQMLLAAGTPIPVLVTIFPEQSLRLVGFHRLLKLDADVQASELLRRIRRRFWVETRSDVTSVVAGEIALYVDDEWHVVHFDERPVAGGAHIRLGSLDPVVLEREILLGIVDPSGQYDVTYTPDTEPFSVIVDAAIAQGRIPIFVPPVAMEDMMAVAGGGVTMPAKSTYFIPKVRSGLFLRLFDELDR